MAKKTGLVEPPEEPGDPWRSGYIPNSIQSWGGSKESGTQMDGERARLYDNGDGSWDIDSVATYGPDDKSGYDIGSTGDGAHFPNMGLAITALEGVYGRNPGTNTGMVAERARQRAAVRRADQLATEDAKARQFNRPAFGAQTGGY